jgi:hypothetical protein
MTTSKMAKPVATRSLTFPDDLGRARAEAAHATSDRTSEGPSLTLPAAGDIVSITDSRCTPPLLARAVGLLILLMGIAFAAAGFAGKDAAAVGVVGLLLSILGLFIVALPRSSSTYRIRVNLLFGRTQTYRFDTAAQAAAFVGKIHEKVGTRVRIERPSILWFLSWSA